MLTAAKNPNAPGDIEPSDMVGLPAAKVTIGVLISVCSVSERISQARACTPTEMNVPGRKNKVTRVMTLMDTVSSFVS